MSYEMRDLADAEIDGVAGGIPLLVAALAGCIEYTLHATDGGDKQPTQTAETGDTGSNTDNGGDTGDDTGGGK